MTISYRYRAIGLGEQDAAMLRGFRDMCKRAGWSLVQREQMIEEYARVRHRMPTMSFEQRYEWFFSVAHTIRLTDDQCAHALVWEDQCITRRP